MSTTTQDKSWVATLQQVGMPNEQLVLALRILGISAAAIGRLLVRTSEEIDTLASKALELTTDVRVLRQDDEYKFDIDQVGEKAIGRLLGTGDFPVSEHAYTFNWVPADKVYSIEKGPDGHYAPVIQTTRPEFHLDTQPGFTDWFEDVRSVFLSDEQSNELLVLLPLASTDVCRWTILEPQRVLSGTDDALRLVASLSALGLGHRDSGHRTKFFANLVWGCQMLFDEIGVGGASRADRPEHDLLRRQTDGLAKDTLVIRQDATELDPNPAAQVFAVDFSAVWQDSHIGFADWTIQDRANAADELVDGLLWLMTHTSGICLRLNLPPRKRKTMKHKVQVLAPSPWIDFASQGHGGQRNGEQKFEPHRHVQDGQGALYYVDAPLHHGYRKNSKSLASSRSDRGSITKID